MQKIIYDFNDILNDNSIIDRYIHDSGYYVLDTESTTLEGSTINEQYCYSVQLMNIDKKFAIFLKNPQEFVDFHNMLHDYLAKGKKLNMKKHIEEYNRKCNFKYFIHNLRWDISFFINTLKSEQFKYNRPKVEQGEKFGRKEEVFRSGKVKKSVKSFNIVEAEGVYYSAKIFFNEYGSFTSKNKRKPETVKAIPTVEFMDSSKITVMSLDAIAKKMLKLPAEFCKVEGYDYDRHRPYGYELTEFEKDYCYNDVYILATWVKEFFLKTCLNEKGNPKGYTASSIAYAEFLQTIEEIDKEEIFPYINPTKTLGKDMRRSYKGGYTAINPLKEVNKIHDLPAGGCSVDYNSHYPNQYKNKKLPIGKPQTFADFQEITKDTFQFITIAFDGFKPKKHNTSIAFPHMQIGSLHVDEFKKYLGKDINGNSRVMTNIFDGVIIGGNIPKGVEETYFHNGKEKLVKHKYILTLTEMEYVFLLNNFDLYIKDIKINPFTGLEVCGNIIVEHLIMRVWVYQSMTGLFDVFTDKFMALKEEGKEIDDEALTAYAKLCLNSVYGKLGTNTVKRVRELLMLDGRYSWSQLDEDENFGEFEDRKSFYMPMASAITSYARVQLMEDCINVGHDNWFYTDTDSIYTNLPPAEVDRILEGKLHPTKLGMLDKEMYYEEFKMLAPKKYGYKGCSVSAYEKNDYKLKYGFKCAGVRANSVEKYFKKLEDFKLGIQITVIKSVQRVGGNQLVETPYMLDAYSYMK